MAFCLAWAISVGKVKFRPFRPFVCFVFLKCQHVAQREQSYAPHHCMLGVISALVGPSATQLLRAAAFVADSAERFLNSAVGNSRFSRASTVAQPQH